MAVRPALNLPADKFIVLTTRRLVYKNSVQTLLQAAESLKADSHVLFVVVGDGPERPRLQNYVRTHGLTNCLLVGQVPDAVLPDYYRAANLFVLPSRTGEGFGIVLLEALASGLPIVATRGGGQVEAVREECNGFLVDACAPDQIAQVICQSMEQPARLEWLGRYGRAMVEREFSWDAHMNKLVAALQEVAETRSRHSASAEENGFVARPEVTR